MQPDGGETKYLVQFELVKKLFFFGIKVGQLDSIVSIKWRYWTEEGVNEEEVYQNEQTCQITFVHAGIYTTWF